ncbi:MAG: hypothetical protein ACXW61_06945 [Gemmatirosa sp.]
MTDTVDVTYAMELLQRLEPTLEDEERALRAAMPALGDDELRETALHAALIGLGTMVSRSTFVYLRWKLECARLAASRTEAMPPSSPREQADAHAAVEAEARALRVPRLMCDLGGARWVVSEFERAGTGAGTGAAAGASCLLFTRARERRRQTMYPHDWRSLPNDALSALLPPG